ncbi:MAG: aminoacyl-histidine dipeptidase [Bacteroidales bacterium]
MEELLKYDIWKYFYQITQIPRPSKKEEKIASFLLDFAKVHGLEAESDKAGNVIIRKKASAGRENLPGVILQSHMDMVCEKNSDKDHDFDKDPIEIYIEDGWVKARGTTLGGDDGIGIAASLAILASDEIEHGPLECLFTSDEETGMTGAFGLQPGFIKGSILLNLDSEDEGELFIGCAGGIDTTAEFTWKPEMAPQESYACKISVSGLNGGHSGDDIDKGLGNSNKILVNFLNILQHKTDLKISDLNGGNLRNAIPREAFAIICIPSEDKEIVRKELNIYASLVENEFKLTEKNLKVDLDSVSLPEMVIDSSTQKNLIKSLVDCPHGVIAMSQSIKGLVETSTNLASVKFRDGNKILVATSQRSSDSNSIKEISAKVAGIFANAGAKTIQGEGYPGWSPNINSEILKITENAYKRLFGLKPKVKAIHAGLECGLFLTKYPNLDMVSFGPTIKGAHSPDERMEIKSVQKFWDLLVEVLKNIH